MEFCDAETDASQEECGSPSLLGGYTDAFNVEDKIRRIMEGDKGQSFTKPMKEDCTALKDSVDPEHEKVKIVKDMCVAHISTANNIDLMNESQKIHDGCEGQSPMKQQKSKHVTPRDLEDLKSTKDKSTQGAWIAPASTVGDTDLVDESQTMQSILGGVKRRENSLKRKKSKKGGGKSSTNVKPKCSVDPKNPKNKKEKSKEKKPKPNPEEDMCIAPTSTVSKTDPCRTKNASATIVKPNRNITIVDEEGRVTSAGVCELFKDRLGQRARNSENLKMYFMADELHSIATFSRGVPAPKTWSKTKLVNCILHLYSYGGSRLHLALLSGTNSIDSTIGGTMLESNLSQGTACVMSESGLPKPSCAVRPSQVDNYDEGWSDCPSPFDGSTIELRDALLAELKVTAPRQQSTYTEI